MTTRQRFILLPLILALTAVAPLWASGDISINGVSCPATEEDLGYVSVSWRTTAGEPNIVQVGVRPYPGALVLWHADRNGSDNFNYVQLGVEYDFFLGSGGSSYSVYNPTSSLDSTWVICN